MGDHNSVRVIQQFMQTIELQRNTNDRVSDKSQCIFEF